MRYAYGCLALSVLLAGCGLVNQSSGKSDGAPGTAPWERPVPKAACGPLDRPETGLQGQVPLADRLNGRSQEGYNCNLALVGQLQEQGASWGYAWYEDCAYMGTANGGGMDHPGAVVIDASERSNPHPSAYLATPAMLDPWESLKVNDRRAMLGAVNGADSGGGPELDLYDIGTDCRHPRHLSTTVIPDTIGHEGEFSVDGQTYYGSNLYPTNATPGTRHNYYYPVDISNPAEPQLMLLWDPPGAGVHGLSLSADGNRGYFTVTSPYGGVPGADPNGLIIADTSDIQLRRADPEIRVISEYYWSDGSGLAQHTIPVTIKGRPFVIFVDEGNFPGKACGSGLAPFSFPRIIDIADETKPQLVAKLMLETHDPDNCPVVMADYGAQYQALFGYDSHYCQVDDPIEPTVLGCGYFNSGIRVFDIRDPWHPREIAYFNPPAQVRKQEQLPGSDHDNFFGATSGAMTADWCSSPVRFDKERGELWTTCQDNGFLILKFTNGVWPFAGAKPARRR
jgi:hypothetical protein